MQVAWQMLEVARLIFSRNEPREYSLLSSTHTVLGDISLEKQDYSQAIEDYKKAVELVERYSPKDRRTVGELLFKLCLSQSTAN